MSPPDALRNIMQSTASEREVMALRGADAVRRAEIVTVS
jgi:hypothetical protein